MRSLVIFLVSYLCEGYFRRMFFVQKSAYQSDFRHKDISVRSIVKGIHGSNFRFLPISQFNSGEHFPRILSIAGVHPGLSVEELFAPKSTDPPDQGMWTYEFPDPVSAQFGTVALPGSDALYNCIDPVIVVSDSETLGIRAPSPLEVLVVIDRSDREFSMENFYAFRNPSGEIEIINMSDEDPSYAILGRVVVCYLPKTKTEKPSTGFLEDEDMD